MLVTLSDVSLHVIDEGPRTAPPLVLVHGVGARIENWEGVARRLASAFRVVRFDLRGHGASERLAEGLTLEVLTKDLEALLDRLAIQRCFLAGHSLGGMIAQKFSIMHPERVVAAAFLSTACGRSEEEKTKVAARVAMIAKGVGGSHFRNSLDRWFTAEFIAANPALIERYATRNAENDPACYAAAYKVLAETDLIDQIGTIRLPVLIVTGENDTGSSPAMAAAMHSCIPSSRLHILPRLKHSILIEAPDDVADLLTTFFSNAPQQVRAVDP
jgi:pimeloyl-ACP methyl ester carboxylesterase